MGKSFLSSAAIAAMLLGVTPAAAQDAFTMPNFSQFYVSVFAGAAFVDDFDAPAPVVPGFEFQFDFDSGYTLGIAVGTQIMPNLRGEVEYSYSESDVDSVTIQPAGTSGIGPLGDIEVQMVLFNLWYDIEISSPIKPYIGGGIGYGHVEYNLPNAPIKLSDDGFAFQLGAGARWSFTDNMALDVSYRYKFLDSVNILTVNFDDEDLESHNIQAAIVIQLGN